MRHFRSRIGPTLALLGMLASCSDPAEPVPSGGDEDVVDGSLTVKGDDGPNDIRIIASIADVEVWVDGETTRHPNPVHSIDIEAGAGDDIVRLAQTLLSDLDFTVEAGAGNDRVVLSAEPGGPGQEMALGLTVAGGPGSDVLDVDVDFSAVQLQQGRVVLDADLGEGDNQAGVYVITSARHTYAETRVRAGDGNNVLDVEHELGGDGEQVFVVELGDGENETSVRFGDGVRGARPDPGARSVTGSYESGSGRNALELHSEIIEPLTSVFTVDYGTGDGNTMGRYKVELPWSAAPPPEGGSQVAPSQTKVIVLGATGPGGPIDLTVDVGDLDRDDPSALGLVSVQAGAAQQVDFDFVHAPNSTTGDSDEVEWTVDLSDAVVTGDATLVVDAPPGLGRLVYLQDALEVAAGVSMDVALRGDGVEDAVLAHLLGVSGAGHYSFLADGGAGNDLLAVLTGDLAAGDGGEITVDVTGGDGDDALALDAPAGLDRDGPVQHAITAGPGTDDCFAGQEVPATDCEARSEIGDQLLALLEAVFGVERVEVWRARP